MYNPIVRCQVLKLFNNKKFHLFIFAYSIVSHYSNVFKVHRVEFQEVYEIILKIYVGQNQSNTGLAMTFSTKKKQDQTSRSKLVKRRRPRVNIIAGGFSLAF